MNRISLAFCIAFLLLSQLAAAQAASTTGLCSSGTVYKPPNIQLSQTTIQNAMATGISLAVLALLLAMSIGAVAYILSVIIPASGLRAWIQGEFWEIAKSGILIGAIYAILGFLSIIGMILNGLTPSGSFVSNIGAIGNVAETYLYSANTNVAYEYNCLVYLGLGIAFLKSLTIFYSIPLPIVVGVIESGFYAVPYTSSILDSVSGNHVSVLGTTLQMIATPTAFVLTLESMLLPQLIVLGLTVLVPLGIVFRAIPFLRGVGGMFVSLGIVLAIVYPALLGIMNAPISSVVASTFNVQTSSNACSGLSWALAVVCKYVSSSFSNFLNIFAIAFESFNSIFPALNLILSFNIYLVLQFILFILDLAIAVPIAMAIAKALGGTMRLGLGGKLRLG